MHQNCQNRCPSCLHLQPAHIVQATYAAQGWQTTYIPRMCDERSMLDYGGLDGTPYDVRGCVGGALTQQQSHSCSVLFGAVLTAMPRDSTPPHTLLLSAV